LVHKAVNEVTYSGEEERRLELVNVRGETTPLLSVVLHSTSRLSQGSVSGALEESACWKQTAYAPCTPSDVFTRSVITTYVMAYYFIYFISCV
jgi:hypothetical protein